MKISLSIKKATPILAVLALGMLILPSYEDAFGLVESGTVETVRTIPAETEGTFQHFIKICASENYRLERPNFIISSDTESFREQVNVNLAPNFCTYQNFTVNAENPSSITIEIVESTNF